MNMRQPKLDKGDVLYFAFALSTITTLFGYTKFAMPHIMRWIEVALP